jgi:transcriptional regulator with XRE-family HTH domain
MTPYRLAQLTGLSKQGVLNLELPGADPKLSTLYRLAEALEVNVHDLIPAGKPPSANSSRPRPQEQAARRDVHSNRPKPQEKEGASKVRSSRPGIKVQVRSAVKAWEDFCASLRPVSAASFVAAVLPYLQALYAEVQKGPVRSRGSMVHQAIHDVEAIAQACRGQDRSADRLIDPVLAAVRDWKKSKAGLTQTHGMRDPPCVQQLFQAVDLPPQGEGDLEAFCPQSGNTPAGLRNHARKEQRQAKR